MRKLHTIILGLVGLITTTPLFSQKNPEVEFSQQAAKFYQSSQIEAFLSWFNSPAGKNFLFIAVLVSGLYFTTLLVLFLLINKEVIRLKENSLLHLFLEDWLSGKEKENLITPKQEPTALTNPLQVTIQQLDIPNLDMLNMEAEPA